MIIQDRSFPHPVLAPFRDDVMPNDFSVALTVKPDADNYYIEAHFMYDNPTLLKLLEAGTAVHALHLECRRNFYRSIFTSSKRIQNLTVPASEIVGRVEVSGFIKAQAPITEYRIQGAHQDYGNTTFAVQPGDILAVAESQTFDAFTDYDPLRHISSILTVNRSEDSQEGQMKLDTTGDRIIATLSQRDFDRYIELKADPKLGPLLANQVVVPALLEAVHEISNTGDDEFEIELNKRWFRSIFKKLKDMGIEIRPPQTPPIEAVQTLLKLPLRRSLEGLILMNPMEEQ
jgi:hypothetical protein